MSNSGNTANTDPTAEEVAATLGITVNRVREIAARGALRVTGTRPLPGAGQPPKTYSPDDVTTVATILSSCPSHHFGATRCKKCNQ